MTTGPQPAFVAFLLQAGSFFFLDLFTGFWHYLPPVHCETALAAACTTVRRSCLHRCGRTWSDCWPVGHSPREAQPLPLAVAGRAETRLSPAGKNL